MELIQKLGMGFLRFLASRQSPPSASKMIELAMRLVSQSRPAEALSLLEAYARLTPVVYENRVLLMEVLRERLAGNDTVSSLQFSLTLSWLLWLEGRRDNSSSVLEASLGLDSEYPVAPAQLVGHIREKLAGVPPDLVTMTVFAYTNLFSMTGRYTEGLAVLETDLGLSFSADEAEFVTAVRRRLELLSPDFAFLYAGGLFNAFKLAGREEEAIWVFKALGTTAELAFDPSDVVSSVRSRLASIHPDAAASFLFHFTGALNSKKMSAVRLALLEQHLDLRPEDYRDLDVLAMKLNAGLAGTLPGTAFYYGLRLAETLNNQGRLQDALAVVRSHTGLAEDMKERVADFGAALRARLEAEIPKDMALLYVTHFANLLTSAARADQSVALLEGYTGLHPEGYADLRSMINSLKRHLDNWSEIAAATSIASLQAGLLQLGENERAGLVSEAFIDASGNLGDRSGGDHLAIEPLLVIYEIWLKRFYHAHDRRPLDVCRELVLYLRQNFETHGVQLRDRSDFIKTTEKLRRQILETGLFWIRQEGDLELSGRLAAEFQLWDAELTQRVLAERFLLEPLRLVSPGPPPVRDWTWKDLERPESFSYLPDPVLARLAASDLGRQYHSSPESSAEVLVRLQRDSSVAQRARELILQGVDESTIAEVLGDFGLLLRGSFDQKGRLHWFAFRSDGHRLRTVAKNHGAPRDLDQLRLAATRHDFRMGLAQFRMRTRVPGRVITVLREVRQALEEIRFELDSSRDPELLNNRLEWVSRRLESPLLLGASRLLKPILGYLELARDRMEGFDDWALETAAQLRDLRDRLSQPAPQRLQEELDRITADYIEEALWVLRLDSLAHLLSPELDLIVQFDDTLHTVPIAHLPVAGEPLFRLVRSVRSSITLLMSSLQLETEKVIGQDPSGPERLLSVSHFKTDDSARQGARWLQHGFAVLAEQHGLEAFAAADEPAGSVGLLRTALEDLQGIRVLAVCGHGDSVESGIILKQDGDDVDRLWQGEGCDLSRVEWLWMVSCSIGRLKQSGDLDVEGFCVQLALHRARSVAAFRWPVHSVEAVALVNESVRLYLEALRDGKGANDRCLRARALNDARKSFFGDGVHPPLYPHVGLNTAAASELFGLG